MPTRATILAATPHCAARRGWRNGQHGVQFICGCVMRWRPVLQRWVCPDCGAKTRVDTDGTHYSSVRS